MADREKVIRELQEALKDAEEDGKFYAEIRRPDVFDTIALLKEQEAKTGHWIYLQYCANEGVYCSECHTKMFDRYPMKKKLSQFCGRCGAKMEG